MKKLSPKNLLFVEEYLRTGNVYQSALKAGYSDTYAKARAHELLEKVGIKSAIDQRRQEIRDRYAVTQDRVIAELSFIAFANIATVTDYDGKSLRVKPFSELSPVEMAAIAEIKEEDTPLGARRSVKMHSKLTALSELFRFTGGHLTVAELIDKMPAEQFARLFEQMKEQYKRMKG